MFEHYLSFQCNVFQTYILVITKKVELESQHNNVILCSIYNITSLFLTETTGHCLGLPVFQVGIGAFMCKIYSVPYRLCDHVDRH